MKYQELVDKTIDFVGVFFKGEAFSVLDIDVANRTAIVAIDSSQWRYEVTFNRDGTYIWGNSV